MKVRVRVNALTTSVRVAVGEIVRVRVTVEVTAIVSVIVRVTL